MVTKSFGNWMFERMLGSGGFGQVELWREKYTNKRIAIKKCMLPKATITPRQTERWAQEIENMKNFQHPNIVKSEPIPPGMEKKIDSPILCMEYCNKGDLRKFLNKPENACGLVQKEVLSVMKDISSALLYLHEKSITHRDLKPDNIVLHEKDGAIIYKLIDLGYAKELGSSTTTASLVGTFNYVAPELFWKRKYTCTVDYWSLGITFFEVLTGYKPFMPYIENLSSWINSVRRKKYEEICASEINGGIQFYDYVIYPYDSNESIFNQRLVDWFRLILQWDPRQRGKLPGTEEVVVFPMLSQTFPWKTINIFTVSLYKIDQFNVYGNVTLLDLQRWLAEKTAVPIEKQLITDTAGDVFNKINNADKLPLTAINDSMLYMYTTDSLDVSEVDSDQMPQILDIMLTEPNKINERTILRQCYTAIIYIMRSEVVLYREYIFALSIKLDIVKKKFEDLNINLQNSSANIELLLNKVNTSLAQINPQFTPGDVMNSVYVLHNKIQNLYTTVTNLKAKAETTHNLSHQTQQFFDNDKLLQNLQNISKLYEDFLHLFSVYENEKTSTFDYLTNHVNRLTDIYSEFFEKKINNLKDPEIIKITSQLVYLEKELNAQFEINKSSMQLINSYENQFDVLINTISQHAIYNLNTSTMPNPNGINDNSILVDVDDTEIRDNIVLRAMMERCLQDIQQSWSKVNL